MYWRMLGGNLRTVREMEGYSEGNCGGCGSVGLTARQKADTVEGFNRYLASRRVI